jgi:hypothetical protein
LLIAFKPVVLCPWNIYSESPSMADEDTTGDGGNVLPRSPSMPLPPPSICSNPSISCHATTQPTIPDY